MSTHTLILLHSKFSKPAFAWNTPCGLVVATGLVNPPAMTEEEAEDTADLVIRLMDGVVAIVKPLPTPA